MPRPHCLRNRRGALKTADSRPALRAQQLWVVLAVVSCGVASGAPMSPLLNVTTAPNRISASWTAYSPSGGASSLLLQVTPLDVNFSFSQAEPFSAAQGWLIDDGSLVTNFSGVSSVTSGVGGVLSLAVNRAVQAVNDRGSPPPPYVLRRIPATGVVQTRIASCAGLAAQPSYFCGLVAYHAGQSAHLFFCGLFQRDGRLELAVDSRGGATLGAVQGTWGDGSELQLTRDAIAGTWVCSGRASAATPWGAAPAVAFSDASQGMASFDEG